MLPAFIISFREAFEALLILVLIVAYLKRIERSRLVTPTILGGVTATLASVVLGLLIYMLYVGIIRVINITLVEAISSFIAVVVLTSIIYWMAKKGPRIREEIEYTISERTRDNRSAVIGMFLLGFIVIFREGFETILFTSPLMLREFSSTIMGIVVGVLLSIAFTYAIFKYGLKIRLKMFFAFTSILLVFIASGILGYGVHELIEYLEDNNVDLGIWGTYVFKLNINEENLLHDKNIVGSMLAILVGYATKMELLRVILQFSYLVLALTLIVRVYSRELLS